MPFEILLAGYLNSGFVWNSPTEFVLAKKVRVEDGGLVDGPANCWFVHLAAGINPFRRFIEVADEKLEFVCWQRRGQTRLRLYTWEQFEKRIMKRKNHGK